MKILVIGNGGREHSLCYAISASPLCSRLYCAPSSDAISELAIPVPIEVKDQKTLQNLLDFCLHEKIDLVVIGPELPLTLGLKDQLDKNGIRAFGVSQAAARLEGSKEFARNFAQRHHIPGAQFQAFSDKTLAKEYILKMGAPIVIKADGLAAGKGVIVALTLEEAMAGVDRLMGEGHQRLVIEEYLIGQEISFFALCDGKTALPLIPVQDHKRAFDGDKGPNTGGMGTYAPPPFMQEDLEKQIMQDIVYPTLKGMAEEGCPYQGIMFLGLMLTHEGAKLIEYNVRFGDPECQIIMAQLFSDIVPALIAATDGALDQFSLRWQKDLSTICVVMAAKGYPNDIIRKNAPIPNLHKLLLAEKDNPNLVIFHAGTYFDKEQGLWMAKGGRVLNIVVTAASLAIAREKAYEFIKKLDWQDGFCRYDIGKSGLPSKG